MALVRPPSPVPEPTSRDQGHRETKAPRTRLAALLERRWGRSGPRSGVVQFGGRRAAALTAGLRLRASGTGDSVLRPERRLTVAASVIT